MDSDRPPRTGRVGGRSLALLALAAASLCGCDDDSGVTFTARVPLAYTRFVHAVADTGPTDWRLIDQIEHSPVAFGLAFRGFTPYQATAPGERRLRVFPTSTDINVTSKFLIDTLLTFENDTYYTIVHFGYADQSRLPAHQIALLRDDIPSVASGNIGIRVLHLGSGLGDIDVFADTLGGSSPLPASPLFIGLSFNSAALYALVDTGRLALRVTNTGQTSPIVVAAIAPPGEAAVPTQNLTAVGGSRMGRSAISAVILPRSVAGTSAPQGTAFSAPALLFLIDKHPR